MDAAFDRACKVARANAYTFRKDHYVIDGRANGGGLSVTTIKPRRAAYHAIVPSEVQDVLRASHRRRPLQE